MGRSEVHVKRLINNLYMSTNVIRHEHKVSVKERNALFGHKSPVIWLTGLSGSGKSTIAGLLESRLYEMGIKTFILDGDNVRLGLNKDLGFSDDDRRENIRRIAEVAKLMSDSGSLTITAFISPFIEERENAKDIIGTDNVYEIYVKADLETCESRDPKGLYKKARAGEIKQFTGIDSPYEEPTNPFRVIDTSKWSIEECVDIIMVDLQNLGVIPTTLKEVDNLDKSNTISIDFDGVIHRYSEGFKGLDNAYDTPMEGAINAITELYERGYNLKILSSRPKDVIYPWLEKYNINHMITEVSNQKFPATIYIDDRGYHFKDWETTMEEIFQHPKMNKF